MMKLTVRRNRPLDDRADDRSTYFIPERPSRLHLEPVPQMAKLNMAIDHGQAPAVARANFERAISAAQDRFSKWIHRADWSANRDSVKMLGPGFDVVLSYDDQKVYARGTVPLAFKLMEVPIRAFITQALAEE
jgi:hypothetical protein